MSKIKSDPEAFLRHLFDTAVAAANPHEVLSQYLPDDRSGKAVVLGAGKAAASMAAAFESAWQGPLSGLVVTRYGHGEACDSIEVVEAAHPVPDAAANAVSQRMLTLATGLDANDQAFCLISGGGSSLLSLPGGRVTLEQKQIICRSLLKSGAPIAEINCVRKHMSGVKGGRLAAACFPASLHTMAISDVPGDDPSIIASGPTVPDATTSTQALRILEDRKIDVPKPVHAWLSSPGSETLKSDNIVFANGRFSMIATPQQSLDAAADYAKAQGFAALVLSDSIEGEAREVAKVHAAIARQIRKRGQPLASPCVVLSGGETSVTVRGNGRGGRNAEFGLSLLAELQGQDGIYALAADTDGIDGSEDNAGVFFSPQTWADAQTANLDHRDYLANSDAYSFFARTDSLLVTGPTRTNVNDFRAILIA